MIKHLEERHSSAAQLRFICCFLELIEFILFLFQFFITIAAPTFFLPLPFPFFGNLPFSTNPLAKLTLVWLKNSFLITMDIIWWLLLAVNVLHVLNIWLYCVKVLVFCLLAHAQLLYFSCGWGQLWLTSQETLCFENMEIPRQLHASLWKLSPETK